MTAFDAETGVLDDQLAALGQQDRAAQDQLRAAVAASVAGRERMDAVIGAAAIDVDALAPVTTPAGAPGVGGRVDPPAR